MYWCIYNRWGKGHCHKNIYILCICEANLVNEIWSWHKFLLVFATWDDLFKWARNVAYEFSFFIVILVSNTSNGQRGKKMYVSLGCEKGGKYKWYKKDLEVLKSGNRKCDYPFRLWEKLIKGGEWWIVKLLCASHNHDLTNTLVGHPYASR